MNKKTWLWIAAGVAGVNLAAQAVGHSTVVPRLKALADAPEGLTEAQLADLGPAGPGGALTKVGMLGLNIMAKQGIVVKDEDGVYQLNCENEAGKALAHAWNHDEAAEESGETVADDVLLDPAAAI